METITRIFDDGGKIRVIIQNQKIVCMSVACRNRDLQIFLKELGEKNAS